MTTLSDFISKVKTTGLSKNNKYLVTIPKPNCVSSYAAADLQMVGLFCDQAQLPGLNISSTQNRTFGEVTEAPYEKLYDNITLNFYVDSNLEVKMFFDNWFNGMQNENTRLWAFYKDYISDLKIAVINEESREVYQVTLHEAYPKNIGAVQMDYAGKDVMKIQVAFNYKYWRSKRVGYAGPALAGDSYRNGITSNEGSGGFDYQGFLSSQGLTDLENFGFNIPTNYFNDFNSFQTTFKDQFGQVKEEVAQVASLVNRFF